MHSWVVKGRPRRNDLDEMLAPGRVARWVTRKQPRDWAAGDAIFFWKGVPALRLMGLGRLDAVRTPDDHGDTFFNVAYLTSPLAEPLAIEELRRDGIVGDASFLKAGLAPED